MTNQAPGSVRLCVAIQRFETSVNRGQTARWVVSAWTQGGNVPDATVRLVAAPAIVSGQFNFGCGTHDGSASCDLGEVDATSAQRELEAQVVVPVTDTSVTSVQLKVIGSAAHLPTDPQAAVPIAVTSPAAGSGTGSIPAPGSSPLSVGNLPYLNGTGGSGSTLSPGGNAGGLFPTLSPSSPTGSGKPGQQANARTVANASALPLGAPVVGAQLIGLGVLALAFVLAVTRLSIRRRPATATAGAGAAAGTARAAHGQIPGGSQPTGAHKPADADMSASAHKPADADKPPVGANESADSGERRDGRAASGDNPGDILEN